MVSKLVISSVFIATQAEIYRRVENGTPVLDIFSPVAVTVEDGRTFYLPSAFPKNNSENAEYVQGYEPVSAAKALSSKRYIDPSYWIEMNNECFRN